MHIEISKFLYQEVQAIKAANPKRIKSVEEAKDKNKIDKELAETWKRKWIETRGDRTQKLENLDVLVASVRDSIDLALAVLAYVASDEDLERVRTRARLLSPQYGQYTKLDVQRLRPRLTDVFKSIADQEGLHNRGVNDKKKARKKVKAAIVIINDAFNSRNTRL